MIRLRRVIERGLAHRWLRFVLLILLVGFFLFVLLHAAHDAVADGAVEACVALIVLIFVIVFPQEGLRPALVVVVRCSRGPPARLARATSRRLLARPTPLRR